MDSSNNIGGASWQNLTSLSGLNAQRPAQAQPSTQPEEAVAVPSESVQLSSSSTAAPVAEQAQVAAPQAELTTQQPRTELPQVPVSLIDDGSHSQIGIGGAIAQAHPTSGLGVIAELHDTSAVRAIGDDSSNNRFAGLHLVGPSNVGQLSNTNDWYLAI